MIPEINIFRNDKEVQQLKTKWKEVFPTEEFPYYSYNYNFTDVADYKQKLKKAIETRDRAEIIKKGSTNFLSEYFS